MKQSNHALNHKLLSLGLLILSLCIFLSGCGVRHNHENAQRAIEHHCEDEWQIVTPPALAITPEPVRPWFKHRRNEYIIPAPFGTPGFVPQRAVKEQTEDDSCEAIFAYVTRDISFNK